MENRGVKIAPRNAAQDSRATSRSPPASRKAGDLFAASLFADPFVVLAQESSKRLFPLNFPLGSPEYFHLNMAIAKELNLPSLAGDSDANHDCFASVASESEVDGAAVQLVKKRQ